MCACGVGVQPVQAVPACDKWGGIPPQRGRRDGLGQTWMTNIALLSKSSTQTEGVSVCIMTFHKERIYVCGCVSVFVQSCM